MASPIGAKGTLTVRTDGKGASIEIQICERAGVGAENLSLSTWGASFILANHLHNIQLSFLHQDNAVESEETRERSWLLELGAGTGLVGLAAAALWKTHAVLTDLPSIMPGLAENIAANDALLKQRRGSATCATLDWTNPTDIRLHSPANGGTAKTIIPESSKPSVILAADTIYSEDHPELLSRTILTWLAPGPESRVILCYPLRMAYIDHVRDFWELMEAGGLECIHEGREQGDEEWNEIANTPYEWCIWTWKYDRRP